MMNKETCFVASQVDPSEKPMVEGELASPEVGSIEEDAKQPARGRGLDMQLSNRLELLNSQLVLYARDFRKLVDSEHRKTLELIKLKRQLADVLKQQGAVPAVAPDPEELEDDRQTLDSSGRPQVVGQSKAIQQVLDLCGKVAPTNATVLLTGETGTGKELTARRIHAMSPRRAKPFIAINCAALPETLLESELYGHEKGAFTGANVSKPGLFELCQGGTLMLDEVGEMPLSLQVKLLRVLEERQIRRVGGTQTLAVDVRVVAATNRDLKAEVSANRFRADLYYRLNVFPIQLPPLRNRAEDLTSLVNHFLHCYGKSTDGKVVEITSDAMSCLFAYPWPGNIRELRNVMERAVLLAENGTIDCEQLPAEVRQSLPNVAPETVVVGTGDSASVLASHERRMVLQALVDTDWNKAAAARKLGISWDNLRYRIKKYGLRPPVDR